MIVKLDALVKSQKNLKGFVVMTQGADTKEWLEKLAADKGIQIPLVYFAKGAQDVGMRLYKLAPAADNTILVNTNRQVVANFVNVNRLHVRSGPGCGCENAALPRLPRQGAVSEALAQALFVCPRSPRSLCLASGGLGVRAQSPAAADIKSVEPQDIKDLVAQNKGKVVVLNFFATWCVPCHTEFPDIIKLQNAYKGKGLQVIEVSMNDVTDKDELQKYPERDQATLHRLHRRQHRGQILHGRRSALGHRAPDDHDLRPRRQERFISTRKLAPTTSSTRTSLRFSQQSSVP